MYTKVLRTSMASRNMILQDDRTTENLFQIRLQLQYLARAKMEEAALGLWDFRAMSASAVIPTPGHYVKVNSVEFVTRKQSDLHFDLKLMIVLGDNLN